MSTLVTIQGTDLPTNSRANINGNFELLNLEKVETSVIDTDTTLADNSNSKIPSQRAVKSYVDANVGFVASSESTSGITHLLTTTVNQRVIVWAKGTKTGDDAEHTITLSYNGVVKDTVTVNGSLNTDKHAFVLMYTETPGAGAQNVTVETTGGTLANVVILVQKFYV